jgi:hypothetical protein
MKPRVTVTDPKRHGGRQWQIRAAAVRADARIGVGENLIQILNDGVPERLGRGVAARQAAHLYDGLDLLGEEAAPPIWLRLGLEEGFDDRLLVIAKQADETLVSVSLAPDAKLATKYLDRDATLARERNDFSAGHANPSALRARRSCSASHAAEQISWTKPSLAPHLNKNIDS